MNKFDEARSKIIDNGISTPNRFNIIIELPSKLVESALEEEPNDSWFNKAKEFISKIKGSSDTVRTISFSVESTEMPGKNISVVDVKYNGDYYKMPYGVVYGVHPVTFRVSRDMFEKEMIDKWMDLIYYKGSHTINYYDDFVSNITIQQLDKNNNVVHAVLLIDAFPTISNPIVYSQADNNTYNRLQVTFAYKKWIKLESMSQSGIGALSQTPLGPIVAPILSNPAVQKGLAVVEEQTGLNLEGESVNIYNNVNDIVKSTTGSSLNKNTTIINKLKFKTETNDKINDNDKSQLVGVMDNVLKAWK